ncbi:hypothetical protein P171DRAFT_36961 [Karstenula rhodostoma CBS 690.94]|uniref:Uncharacterized protein n=1 Tax=Karstenula rhodostoma CBS 690.94 TaxID=1392251 RepID=A0A9P4PG81_9PLEO|nr:hypothetical protein P171DRAFT_36961 [Karstenula rhodostoma CBS 690.94]
MSSVDASRDPRRQGTGHAGSASPMHAASPISMANGDAGQQGSGNTTPVHGAPPAPSMVPQKRIPATGGTNGVASIRQTVLKKQTAPGVGSENVALASIRARQIDLQRSMKTATEQIDAVQTEQKKATSQREHAERDLKTQLGHLQDEHEKVTLQRELAETDLKSKLSQLRIELETEKKQRLQMEQRLQKLEEKQGDVHSAPTDPNLSKQVNELVLKIQQLEAQSKPDALTKQAAQQDSAKIQTQIETHVKQSVQSDIKAHGDRIAELETKSTAIQTTLEQPKPKYEDIIKQSIEKEITPLKSRLDTFDLEKSKTRLNKLTQEVSNAIQAHETGLDELKEEVKATAKINDDRLDKLEKGVKTATVKSTASDKRLDALVKADIKLLKEDLATQKENSMEQFKKVENDMSKKSAKSQYELLKKQLEAVPEPIKSYVDKRVEQQVLLHINLIKAALERHIIESTDIIKRDIGEDIAKIRQDVEQNESTMGELGSSTSASMKQLRKDITSDVSATVESLRSEISVLDPSSGLAGVQLEFEELKSANSSDIKRLRQEMGRLRTVSVPSASQDFATKEMVGQLDDRLFKTEKTATNALEEAINAINFTNSICDGLDECSGQVRAIEETVKALQDEVKSLHEKTSSRPDHTGPALVSLSSLSRDHEATNIVREDTRAENSAVEHRLDQLDLALKSLTSRCDNITTDYLHQSMLQWFHQYYPNAPNFLGELQHVQGELRRIGDMTKTITWMSWDSKYGQQLRGLIRDSDAIQQLLRDKNIPGDPGTSEELDSIRNKIETEAQKRIDELNAVRAEVAAERSDRIQLVNGLKPIHNVFGATCSQVERLEDQFTNLNTKVDNVVTKVDNLETEVDKVDSARKLLASSVITLNEQSSGLAKRMSTMESTTEEQGRTLVTHQESIGEYLQTTLQDTHADQFTRVDDTNSTIEQHGRVQETHQELIKKFNANIATILVTCYELQKFTRMINQNLKGGGFPKHAFDFSYSFEEPPKP